MSKIFSLKSLLLISVVIISAITVYSKFLSKPKIFEKPANMDELFDEDFLNINTLPAFDSLVSNRFRSSNYDTARTVLFIDNFLRNRFYHSYSELDLKDNWIAVLCGYIFWGDFLYPVAPEYIIEHPMAACSQQGILFQYQLNRLKIKCSTIQFFPLSKTAGGHYAVSVYYDNSWHFYDSNQEPLIVDSTMPSINVIIDKRLYEKMYIRESNKRFREFFEKKSYIRVFKEPLNRGKMYYFHQITTFLSNWLWLLLLIAYAGVTLRERRRKQLELA
jgi:hypothetical protein